MNEPLSRSETQGEFSVWWWDPEGNQHAEKRFCSPEEAGQIAISLIRRPAAKIGIIKRVIITDGGDCCNFEWKFGEGITFPKPAE